MTATLLYILSDQYYEKLIPRNFSKKQSKDFYSTWKFSFIPNNIRSFSLKRVTNRLLMNNQLAHINSNISPLCSWCKHFPLIDVQKESFFHFFYECRTTNELLRKHFLHIFEDQIDMPELIFKGHKAKSNFEIIYINIEVNLFLFFLFSIKNSKKRIPSYRYILTSMNFTKRTMMSKSKLYFKCVKWIKKNKKGDVENQIRELEMIG